MSPHIKNIKFISHKIWKNLVNSHKCDKLQKLSQIIINIKFLSIQDRHFSFITFLHHIPQLLTMNSNIFHAFIVLFGKSLIGSWFLVITFVLLSIFRKIHLKLS